MIGPMRYIMISLKLDDNIAGPRVLAGFIDAPVNGPATNEQTATTPPIDNPVIDLDTLLSVATLIIVNIKNMVIKTSSKNPWTEPSLLIVALKL